MQRFESFTLRKWFETGEFDIEKIREQSKPGANKLVRCQMWYMHPAANRRIKVRFFDVPPKWMNNSMVECLSEELVVQVRVLLHPQTILYSN